MTHPLTEHVIRFPPATSGRPRAAGLLGSCGVLLTLTVGLGNSALKDASRLGRVAAPLAAGLGIAGVVALFASAMLAGLVFARSMVGIDRIACTACRRVITAGAMPRFDLRELAAIFAGGAVGALARAGLLEWIPAHPGRWPWATFIVNVVGAFLLGYFATRLQERLPLSAYRRPFLGTGLCGALTTFSTVQVELLRMLDRDEIGLAVAYAGASVATGFAAVLLATAMVRRARLVA